MTVIENKNYKYQYSSSLEKYANYDYKIEFIRKESVVYLRENFIDTFFTFFDKEGKDEKLVRKLNDIIASWFFINISLKNKKSLDPVIPDYPFKTDSMKQLEIDLINLTKESKEVIDTFIKELELNSWTQETLELINDKIENIKNNFEYKDIKFYNNNDKEVTLKMTTEKIKIPMNLYNRIVKLYMINQSFSTLNREDNKLMNYLIFLIFYRYNYIDANSTRQGSLRQNVFDFLFENGVDFECFSSIFNASSSSFNSLFYDLERFFGSKGNFFTTEQERGIYQFNPPLNEYLTQKAVERQLDTLKTSKNSLVFIDFLPPWEYEQQEGYVGTFDVLKKIKSSGIKYKEIYNKDKKIKYTNYYTGKQTDFRMPVIMIVGNEQGFKDYESQIKKMERYLRNM